MRAASSWHFSVVLAFGLIGVFSFYAFLSPASTGFVSSEAVAQWFNLSVQHTSAFDLSPYAESPLRLQSLRISGSVETAGGVSVYLFGSDGSRRLVYTNIGPSSGNRITGMATGGRGDRFAAVATGAFSLQRSAVDEDTLQKETSAAKSAVSSVLSQLFSESDDALDVRRVETFSGECFETCDMPPSSASYRLVVDVEPGTLFHLDNIIYTLYD